MTLPRDETDVLLLHNPRCSKSRATQALLEQAGIAHRVRLYLEEPLALAELQDLQGRLDRPAREWIRRGESAFREADLGSVTDDESLLEAVAGQPILMERPIVVRGSRAAVGRPPEAVLELFEPI